MAKIADFVTSDHTIWSGSNPQKLLVVPAGVSVGDALSEASDTLAAARDIVDHAATNSEKAVLWGGVALIEIAKGFVDAALEAVGRAEIAAEKRQTMTDLAKKFNDAQCDAWAVYNLLEILCAALPEDGFDSLPVRCTVRHIMGLAKTLPETIEQLEREVDRG